MSCFLKKMRNTIFQDPAVFQDADNWGIFVGWVLSPRYLCGNLPHKLKLVQEMQQRFPSKFETNVVALERRLPQRQTINQIHISLGSPWVPAEKYSQFVKELLQLSKRVPVYLSPELAKWKIEIPADAHCSVCNTSTYGTVAMSALNVIDATYEPERAKIGFRLRQKQIADLRCVVETAPAQIQKLKILKHCVLQDRP